MWLDIFIAVVFVLSTAFGYRRGFVHTFIHTIGWILSIVIALAFHGQASNFLRSNTAFYDALKMKIEDILLEKSAETTAPIVERLPKLFVNAAESAEETLSTLMTDGISDFLFNMVSFLLVILAVRVVLLIVVELLSKKKRNGLIGFVDGVLGLAAGAVKGVIIVFLLLALITPLIGITSDDLLTDQLADSRIAGTLYDNNLILHVIKDAL